MRRTGVEAGGPPHRQRILLIRPEYMLWQYEAITGEVRGWFFTFSLEIIHVLWSVEMVDLMSFSTRLAPCTVAPRWGGLML